MLRIQYLVLQAPRFIEMHVARTYTVKMEYDLGWKSGAPLMRVPTVSTKP